MITLQREKKTVGYYSPGRFVRRTGEMADEIALNPSYFASDTVPGALSTLVHEMTHAWQYHFGNPGRARYHNREWADKMDDLGLAASHNGRGGGKRTGDHMSHYIVRGGRFDQDCQALMTDKFMLSWMDRFSSPWPGTQTADKIMPTTAPGANQKAQGQGLAQEGQAGESAVIAPDTGNIDQLPKQVRDKIVVLDGPTKTTNRSNRMKYRCPTCKTQVWGKAGIRVLCGGKDCKAGLMPAVM